MINRICISINNRCNLKCKYCHFNEKSIIKTSDMDVFYILDNVKKYANHKFKIGFVGNGEALLDWESLKSYIQYIEDDPYIEVYTITNGTIDLSNEDWLFLDKHNVNVGFSIDGYKELHDINRSNSFDKAMKTILHYKEVTGHFPTFNATVGKETLENADKVIEFFAQFGTRVTFSRMIGKYAITLEDYHDFLDYAETKIPVRRGDNDCTMYGGKCGAGINNYFFANEKVYYCGNCIDLAPIADSYISFYDLEKINLKFDRKYCFKESL